MAASTATVNVQEMVRKNPEIIPKRYLRTAQERTREVILCAADSPGEIPILDLALLESGQAEEHHKLDKACATWGFFLVTNHGIEKRVLQDVKKATDEFFSLPIEEKTRFNTYGQAVSYSEEQTMDWSDAIMLPIFPLHPRQTEIWPSTPPEFRYAAEAYSIELRKVAEKLLVSLSSVMGMEKDNSLIQLQNEMLQAMRVNYCPPCSRPDLVMALSPHSDSTTISIVMQDDDVTALQIRHKGGWIPVKPLPNSLVVNVGDFLEIWSNGRYESIEHRVVPNQERARVSFATFFYPSEDVEVEPLDHLVNGYTINKKYKKVNSGEYLKQAMAKKMEGKSHTAFAKHENK